jgi:ethanolamine utilization cobalamin adenosyltransferase
MRAVTEAYLRKRFRSEKPKTFALEKGMILTPSARQYLSELRIELVSDVQSSAPVAVENQTPAEKDPTSSVRMERPVLRKSRSR